MRQELLTEISINEKPDWRLTVTPADGVVSRFQLIKRIIGINISGMSVILSRYDMIVCLS